MFKLCSKVVSICIYYEKYAVIITPTWNLQNGAQDWAEIEKLSSLMDQNQISEEWKNQYEKQIKEYFRHNNIHTITLEGDNLIVKYNGGEEGILEVNDLQSQIIKKKVAQSENHSLSFPELKKPTDNNSSPITTT